MKKRMVLGFAALAALAMAKGGVLIRHTFASGSTEVYKVTMNMANKIAIPSMGDQDMSMTGGMTYTMSYGAADEKTGKSDLKMKITDLQMKIDSAMGDMSQMMGEMPKEMLLNGKIDSRNRLSDLKADGQAAMMMMSGTNSATMGLFIEFPEKEVNIGDTWEVVLPKNPMTGNLEAKLTAKLEGEKDVEGKPVWIVSMAGQVPMKVDMAELMKNQPDPTGGAASGMEMVITGTIDLKSTALVDKATGKTLSMTTDMKNKQTMDMTSMGMSIDMNGTMKIDMKLQK